ncbi:DUF1826 domain-containing protein [Thalassotalea sp. M1531]|uniref:DUF1826 domain-containing protein n=1 Tax=Thalassotalea algicola TaxID=2716224 RepID=A0A7Y0LBM8_9GAMM|nr:DUF1826 domain-containing protein [Thalassotalea algicola]NMP31573.1 DUF1826 domain-containing protein [Thalassotalea algicola]
MEGLTLKPNSKNNIEKYRESVVSRYPDVLTEIYQEKVNIAIWQRTLSNSCLENVSELLTQQPNFKVVVTVTPDEAYQHLAEHLSSFQNQHELCQQVSLLVDMFCTLFELKRVGLRLTALDRPMCPKFHVDKVPCRLVTTFTGSATQWLENNVIDRTKLGAGSIGLPDEESGVYESEEQINQLLTGDVALLKGEGWFDNLDGGLVHRSPAVKVNERRLLLTLDFID